MTVSLNLEPEDTAKLSKLADHLYGLDNMSKEAALIAGAVTTIRSLRAEVKRGEISEDDGFDADKARKDLKPEAWEILKQPVVQSLLYDINLLPEQITTGRHWFYMLSVLSHMSQVPKREIVDAIPDNEEVRDVLTWAHNVSVEYLSRLPSSDGTVPMQKHYLHCLTNAVEKLRKAKNVRIKAIVRNHIEGGQS